MLKLKNYPLNTMKIKCLLSCFGDNYIIYLNGNTLNYLILSLKAKTDLWPRLSQLTDLNFEIFDRDFNEYVLLDDSIEIESLSRIRLKERVKDKDNVKERVNDQNTQKINSIESPSLIQQNVLQQNTVQHTNEQNLIQKDMLSETSSNISIPEPKEELSDDFPLPLIQLQTDDDDEEISDEEYSLPTQLETPPPAPSLSVEWPHESVMALLHCCAKHSEIFRQCVYNVKVQTWQKVSHDLHEMSFNYDSEQCQHKFARLRATYINIISYPNIMEETKWSYFEILKDLIGTNPIEFRRNEFKPLKHTPVRSQTQVSELYLTLIQLVRKYISQFLNVLKPKNETWKLISQEMVTAGFDVTPKNCQSTFHRMRYNFLHLLRTVHNESEAQQRWPYFYLFQDIDLTPFRSKVKSDRRLCEKRKDPPICTGVSSTLSLENDQNSPYYDVSRQDYDYDDDDDIQEIDMHNQYVASKNIKLESKYQ